jgi:hypothetical protein
MNYSTHTVVAVISFAFGTLALQPVIADTNVRIARAETIDAGATSMVDAQAFSQYAGRYELDDGAAFIVDDDGEFLTLELPEAWGGAKTRLHAQTARDFLADMPARVTFEIGSDGRVRGLVFYPEGETEAVAAAKVYPRGIVTIHDVPIPASTVIAAACESALVCS